MAHTIKRWTVWDPLLSVAPAMVLLLGAALIVLRSPDRINHDCSLYLQCGQLLLEGQRPYVDFIDLNPPFIFYLNVIPAFLARLFATPIIPTFSLCVLGLALWSTLSIQRTLRTAPHLQEIASAAAIAWALFTLVIRSGTDFGQREHLMVLLYLPYLAARSAHVADDPASRRGRLIVLALAAGCGVCVKPQYLLVAGGLEIYWALQTRRVRTLWSPPAVALAAVPTLYLIHFAFLPAPIRDAFLHRWLPLIVARYSVYDLVGPFPFRSPMLLAGCLGLAAIGASIWMERPFGTLVGALGLFVGCAVGVYFGQHKGWPYHRLPAVAALAILLTVVSANGIARRRKSESAMAREPSMRLALATAIVVVCGWIVALALLFLPLRNLLEWEPAVSATLTRYADRGDAVLFVSTSVAPAYPLLLQKGLRPGSRYLWFFPIPMLATSPQQEEWLRSAERNFLADLKDDLATRRPQLVFVPTGDGCQACPEKFNLQGYLEDTGISSAIRDGRTRVADVEGWAVFVDNRRLGR